MENWWKYCLSLITILVSVILWMSRDKLSNETYHHLDASEKLALSAKYVTIGNTLPQGTPKQMRILEKAIRLNPRNDEAWSSLGEPYLYQGLYKEWNSYINKAVQLNPERWQAQRGSEKLFFFRDYAGALYDLDATDTLTIDKTDYVDRNSVDYLRGLCYYALKNYDKAQEYFELYLKTENAKTGSKQIDKTAYLYQGMIANYKQDYKGAIEVLKKGIGEYDHYADIFYQLAFAHFMIGEPETANEQIQKAKKLFEQNDYHRHKFNLYEVIDQIYLSDIEKLQKEIECFL